MSISNKIPFIAGNWKMYKSEQEAVSLVQALAEAGRDLVQSEMVVIPPFTALSEVRKAIGDSSLQLGAQNCHWEDEGAFTGEISAAMLKASGCIYVVLGHSERRQFFGETDKTVNKKIMAVLRHGLFPIMCLGETLDQREKGQTLSVVDSQLTGGLAGLSKDEFNRVIIAYEPIWAIGTGLTATPQQAQDVHAFIREKIAEKYGNESASCAIILYGGSVKPANAYTLLKEKDINGALVGGASLKVDSFTEITKEAVRAYKEKE
jgi:triosephosphate isomerase